MILIPQIRANQRPLTSNHTRQTDYGKKICIHGPLQQEHAAQGDAEFASFLLSAAALALPFRCPTEETPPKLSLFGRWIPSLPGRRLHSLHVFCPSNASATCLGPACKCTQLEPDNCRTEIALRPRWKDENFSLLYMNCSSYSSGEWVPNSSLRMMDRRIIFSWAF